MWHLGTVNLQALGNEMWLGQSNMSTRAGAPILGLIRLDCYAFLKSWCHDWRQCIEQVTISSVQISSWFGLCWGKVSCRRSNSQRKQLFFKLVYQLLHGSAKRDSDLLMGWSASVLQRFHSSDWGANSSSWFAWSIRLINLLPVRLLLDHFTLNYYILLKLVWFIISIKIVARKLRSRAAQGARRRDPDWEVQSDSINHNVKESVQPPVSSLVCQCPSVDLAENYCR